VPLNCRANVAGIRLEVASVPDSLTFHQLQVQMDDLHQLAPDFVPGPHEDWQSAVVVKRSGDPMLAICRGEVLGQPVMKVLNLTEKLLSDQNPIVLRETEETENWQNLSADNASGGWDVSAAVAGGWKKYIRLHNMGRGMSHIFLELR
jgi:hypothetical protein